MNGRLMQDRPPGLLITRPSDNSLRHYSGGHQALARRANTARPAERGSPIETERNPPEKKMPHEQEGTFHGLSETCP